MKFHKSGKFVVLVKYNNDMLCGRIVVQENEYAFETKGLHFGLTRKSLQEIIDKIDELNNSNK